MGLLNSKTLKSTMPTIEQEADIEPVAAAPVEEQKIDTIKDAIKNVIKKSLAAEGLVRGLNQVGKALDRKDAYLCILAEDCDDPKYKKLISALAKQNKIPLIEIDSRTDLGMWLGQCKYDKEGVPRKTKGASSCAIKDYGETSDALSFLEQYIKEHDL